MRFCIDVCRKYAREDVIAQDVILLLSMFIHMADRGPTRRGGDDDFHAMISTDFEFFNLDTL